MKVGNWSSPPDPVDRSEPDCSTGHAEVPSGLGTDHVEHLSLVLFDSGDEVVVQAGEQGIRFLLVSGKPLKEPVAWYGPIVMNTQEQLRHAFEELKEGTFLESEPKTD